MTDKTISKHINNTALFINDYLNYYDVVKAEESMQASRNTAKDTSVILKKFYQYMCENNYVFKEDY